MATAAGTSPTEVKVEIDTGLSDADINSVLDRVERDIDREYANPGFADTQHRVDFEAVLEVDPNVLLTLWGMTSTVDFEALQQNLEDHSIGRELAAVKNDRVYTQGTRFQGPLMNLFQLEMTAKQLYPDTFGEWPGYETGQSYPEFAEDQQLFDRERVVEIIDGDI
jgi:hypothetical protein